MLLSVESPDLTDDYKPPDIESPRNSRTRRGRTVRALPRCPRYDSSAVGAFFRVIDSTDNFNSQNIESPLNTRTRRGRALRVISRCPRNCSCGSYAVVRGITGSHGRLQTAGHRVTAEYANEARKGTPGDFALSAELQLWQLCCCPWNHRISRTTTNRRTSSHRGIRERGAEGTVRVISRCPRNCSCGSYAVVRGITGSHGRLQTAGPSIRHFLVRAVARAAAGVGRAFARHQ